MNLGSTFVGIVLAIICIAPFLVLDQQRKKKKRNRLKSLNLNAHKVECKIDTHEFCGDYLIGIDTKKGVLFFNKKLKENSEEVSINLTQVKECSIYTRYQEAKIKGQNFKEIQQLSLSFIPLDKSASEIKLTFFDADINMMLSGELESIKKWLTIINTQLAAKT
ncbi:hypothetical protein KCTC32516_00139 [Polaribacter huanghezhanensis]|uniref:hypothetical protein n=1 Tax=Polaribacter huanghezhanensis TaxID=1354726 RepID=UPI00264A2A18|nr:hypothetical protein [Polaribacter huanghezhanensis]WKD84805.1 hypothetical protein KCTC32516_00139 [Polaribacter huanghezhanensis]